MRFHNGQSAKIEVNMSHTVGDLHAYVMSVAPVEGSYQLVAPGRPPKTLDDPSKTIEQEGLSRASIIQKLT